MEKLKIDNYHMVRAFLDNGSATPTFAYAVMDLVIKGDIYVNSMEDISSVIVNIPNGICFADGDINYLESILDLLLKKAILNQTRFTLFTHSAQVQSYMEQKYDVELKAFERISFRSFASSDHLLRNEYTITFHDSNTIKRSKEFPESYYQSYWGSSEAFLEKGLGVVILKEGKIIAECISIFKSNTFAEIDIWTDSNYRGKGLGTEAAATFINKLEGMSMKPRWDCDMTNIASIRLGEKLGFQNPEPYIIYSLIHK